ncbi:hypothetical protein V2J52_10760 [Georgenia sp. MJ173]|uniref:hypothetical protein n=1 Tax=Georgenia sunbinii TaxID=3117728 RepID=UPI002F2649DE
MPEVPIATRPLAALAAAALTLAGCASGGDADESADIKDIERQFTFNVDHDLNRTGPEQREALIDGEVTQEEYNAGFERYRACLSAEGYEIHSIELVGVVWHFGVPAEAVDAGVEEECNFREYWFVDSEWQIMNRDDMHRIYTVNYCLSERGLATATTVAEAEQLLSEAGLDFAACEAELGRQF